MARSLRSLRSHGRYRRPPAISLTRTQHAHGARSHEPRSSHQCCARAYTMGIKNLSKLIGDCAPAAVRELNLKELMGRTIAIDASMAIYQFLVAVRSASQGGNSVQLTNAAGEVTSHLQGMFNRTIRMLESGIKPVYVFDGKPPQMKSGEVRSPTVVARCACHSVPG